MIYTLSSSLALYHINRNRTHWLTAMERRRVFWLACVFVVLVTAAVYFAIFAVMP
jgi:type IV secretory pathway component VirB8